MKMIAWIKNGRESCVLRRFVSPSSPCQENLFGPDMPGACVKHFHSSAARAQARRLATRSEFSPAATCASQEGSKELMDVQHPILRIVQDRSQTGRRRRDAPVEKGWIHPDRRRLFLVPVQWTKELGRAVVRSGEESAHPAEQRVLGEFGPGIAAKVSHSPGEPPQVEVRHPGAQDGRVSSGGAPPRSRVALDDDDARPRL
ncbi:MAG: hypothetical protein H6Q05_3113 [Acidobacteria bacterium]|nr:hypothetical protein [Acidobacteriota bacterium]